MRREPSRRRAFRVPGLRALQREAQSEIAFHINERIEELMSQGMDREAAEREVQARFGDVDRISAEMQAIDRVRYRRLGWREQLGALARDARLSVRGMARQPLTSVVIVATLALAIGANTAIYSVADRLLLRPIPTPALDRMVVVTQDLPTLDLHHAQLSPAEALDLAARTDLFERATGYTTGSVNLTGEGEPQRVGMVATAGDFFGTFSVRPAIGHGYRAEDSRPGAPRVAVLSYSLWRELGIDSALVAAGTRSIDLEGARVTVIGVMPPDFRFPRSGDVFVPFVVSERVMSPQQRFSLYFNFVGRRRSDVPAERLAAELLVEADRWKERYQTADSPAIVLESQALTTFVAGELGPVTVVLSGAVALVLLIACANVGSLQLVRTIGRAHEIAVRAALGAGRATVIRQSLIESLVLALSGGVVGVGVGWLVVRALATLDAGRYAMLNDVQLDRRALAVTAGTAIVAGVLLGLMPAWRAARVDLGSVLKESGRGSSLAGGRHRMLGTGVVVQLALTLVLLLGSLLTVRSLTQLVARDPGFRPDQVATLRVSLPGATYASPAARLAFFDRLRAEVAATPGVSGVGMTAFVPFGGGGDSSPFDIPGRPVDPNAPPRHANTQIVAGDYFRTMGIPLLAGRTFTDADDGAALSVIIDAELAARQFGDANPIGQIISQGRPATIIGVVGRVPRSSLGEPPHATIYYPYSHYAWLRGMTLVARSALPLPQLLSRTRAVVRTLDPRLPVYEARSMPELIAGSTAPQRLAVLALGAFAALSLLLSLLGVYGVMGYSTAQRAREIGIRMALGARPGDVIRMVVQRGLGLALLGVAFGFVVYAGASRAVSALLFGVTTYDPLTLLVSAVVLVLIAAIASYIPAHRAARVDTARVLGTQ